MSLLLALRRQTREAHERLEVGLDVAGRCRTREGYADVLARLRSAYAPLEAAVGACPSTASVVPDWGQRRKTAWLDADLAGLGVAPFPGAAVPTLASVEDVLGTVYVMEGATLGGAQLVTQLRESFAAPPPHRFFSSYGARRGAMWHAFRVRAEALGDAGADPDRVVGAARRAFGVLEASCARAGAA